VVGKVVIAEEGATGTVHGCEMLEREGVGIAGDRKEIKDDELLAGGMPGGQGVCTL